MNEERLIIECRAAPPFMKNGYVLACEGTGKGIYIDPGDEVELLLDLLVKREIDLIAVVNTHAHMDHICGIGKVKEKWDVPVYLHPEDQELYDGLPFQGQWFGVQYSPAPAVDEPLSEGQKLEVGNLVVEVHHTPGHSPGHVCLVVENHVFCGDTVMAGSIGRTDLPGGSLDLLMRSIRDRILPLGDDKILHPGHGPETTIGRERKENPFLVD
ncbi:MAG: MBL fold metallo-hydrolase [Acidobacteriota bacterium]